jgi:hypothetical protein
MHHTSAQANQFESLSTIYNLVEKKSHNIVNSVQLQ